MTESEYFQMYELIHQLYGSLCSSLFALLSLLFSLCSSLFALLSFFTDTLDYPVHSNWKYYDLFFH